MTEARTTPDNTRRPGVWLFVLLRVPLSDRPVVSLVCRNWKDIVDSERFSELRRQFGCAETTLVALTWTPPQQAEEGGRLSVFVKEGGHSWSSLAVPGEAQATEVAEHLGLLYLEEEFKILLCGAGHCWEKSLRGGEWKQWAPERSLPPSRQAARGHTGFASGRIGSVYLVMTEERTFALDREEWKDGVGWAQTVPTAPEPLRNASAVSVDDCLYLFGGADFDDELSGSVQTLCKDEGEWSWSRLGGQFGKYAVFNADNGVMGGAAVAVGSGKANVRIYLMGGLEGVHLANFYGETGAVWVLDHSKHIWTRGPELPFCGPSRGFAFRDRAHVCFSGGEMSLPTEFSFLRLGAQEGTETRSQTEERWEESDIEALTVEAPSYLVDIFCAEEERRPLA